MNVEAKIPNDSMSITPAQVSAPATQPRHDLLLDVLTSKILLVLGSLLALVNIGASVNGAVLHSSDFQWSGAHLLLQHRDPWAVFLSGDPHHEILLRQAPNYLHELYILSRLSGKSCTLIAQPI